MDEDRIIEIAVHPSTPVRLNVEADERPAVVAVHAPVSGTRDYNKLSNRPSINEVLLVGDLTPVDLKIVSENTTEEWDAKSRLYVPQKGEICFYTDSLRVKIGDGEVPLIDLPFVGAIDNQRITYALTGHIMDISAHVSDEDRERWNNKLNYVIVGDELVFNRL